MFDKDIQTKEVKFEKLSPSRFPEERLALLRQHAVVDIRTLPVRVSQFCQGNVLKRKPPSSARTARTPENVERVRGVILKSPGHSARRHLAELGMSRSSVRRIFQKNLGSHLYKIMII
ncbi:hypothetical protein ILUMI_20834 [Ignelater luminosus]|uniref:Transposase n=1 Tax=Ignelater luminosus TaxID=2038154 RepID=A0A8K0CDE7_IGNLU|nr:hypothetical protein ILUMI_20834 [Ignelater luminosus]